ncbi:MAG: amidohydrolase family protein [Alphaproteobacteria bacterium]
MTARRIPVDWHTHIWLPEHFGGNVRTPAGSDVTRGSPERAREAMEGVDRYVVVGLQTPWLHIPNDFIAEQVKNSKGRAIGFACVDPKADDAPREMERAIGELGLHGLKLSPTYQGFDPRDKSAWRLYEIADRLNIPLMWHVGGGAAITSTLENGNPLLLDPIARAFPNLRMIVAHFGQPHMEETVMLVRKNKNVFTDLSARFHRPWQLYNGLAVAKEYGILPKILFGSDYPNRSPMEALELFRRLSKMTEGTNLPHITPEDIDSIVYDRPLNLLGFD